MNVFCVPSITDAVRSLSRDRPVVELSLEEECTILVERFDLGMLTNDFPVGLGGPCSRTGIACSCGMETEICMLGLDGLGLLRGLSWGLPLDSGFA